MKKLLGIAAVVLLYVVRVVGGRFAESYCVANDLRSVARPGVQGRSVALVAVWSSSGANLSRVAPVALLRLHPPRSSWTY